MISGILGAFKSKLSKSNSTQNIQGQREPLKGSLSSQSFHSAHADSKMSNDDELSSSDEKDYSEIKAVADAKAKAAADAKAKAAHEELVEKLRPTFKKPKNNHKETASEQDDTCGVELLPVEKKETDKNKIAIANQGKKHDIIN